MKRIPVEEALALIRQRQLRQEASEAHLVQQEILVALTAALHRAGLVDGKQVAVAVRHGIADLRDHGLMSEHGVLLADLFQGRLLDEMEPAPSTDGA